MYMYSDYDDNDHSSSTLDNRSLYRCFTRFLTTKEKFHEFLASGRPGQSRDEPDADSEEPSGEPEQKRVRLDSDGDKRDKKKMRGQNKSRPHVKPQSYEDRRLCPSIVQVRTSYLHNTGALIYESIVCIYICDPGAQKQS